MNYMQALADSSPIFLLLVLATAAMFLVALAFLGAAYRLRLQNERKAAYRAELEYVWGATLGHILRGTSDEMSLHAVLDRDQQLVFLDFLYKRSLSDPALRSGALHRRLAEPYLDLLIHRAGHGDVWQRARAIRTLGELAGRRADGVIIGALDDPAPHVALTAARVYAARGLGPVNPLLDRISRYDAWDRRLLRRTLASFGAAAVPALEGRLADRKAPHRVRAACAEALADIDCNVNSTAAAVLRDAADLDLIAAVLRALRRPASTEQRAIVRRLCSSERELVRAQAVACLDRIGEADDQPLLEAALADLSPWVVLNASRRRSHGNIDERPLEWVPAGNLQGLAS